VELRNAARRGCRYSCTVYATTNPLGAKWVLRGMVDVGDCHERADRRVSEYGIRYIDMLVTPNCVWKANPVCPAA
jgi:hypothetical protein